MESSRKNPVIGLNDNKIMTVPTLAFEMVSFEHGSMVSRTRQIAVVNGIPMYQSTGRNSCLEGTWFPFLGLNGRAIARHSRMWFMKPHGGRIKQHSLSSLYPAAVVSFVHLYAMNNDRVDFDKTVRTVLGRFGNLQAMAISASIGGGFWTTNEGSKLHRYLRLNFEELMLKQTVHMLEVFHEACILKPEDSIASQGDAKNKAVATVNGFINQNKASPLFFAMDSSARAKVYNSFPEPKNYGLTI